MNNFSWIQTQILSIFPPQFVRLSTLALRKTHPDNTRTCSGRLWAAWVIGLAIKCWRCKQTKVSVPHSHTNAMRADGANSISPALRRYGRTMWSHRIGGYRFLHALIWGPFRGRSIRNMAPQTLTRMETVSTDVSHFVCSGNGCLEVILRRVRYTYLL